MQRFEARDNSHIEKSRRETAAAFRKIIQTKHLFAGRMCPREYGEEFE